MLVEQVPNPPGRFLVIGCGSIGMRHVHNLRKLGVTDIAAFDVSQDRRQEVGQRFEIPVFDDLQTALAHGALATVICTPTHLHLQHALEAARAGSNLFIEKPVAHSLDGLDELKLEVARHGLATLVGCNFRFHPGLRHVKTLVADGVAGSLVSARAQFGQYLPDWHPWEDYRGGYSAHRAMGGGVVLDRIHDIDYLRWILGEVSEVAAMMDHLSHIETDTEDTAEILFRFSSGVLGSVHVDYVRRTYNCSLELVGDLGTITWSYEGRKVRWYCASESAWRSLEWPRYDENEMYLEEMRHFLRVLKREELSELDVTEGARVLAIAVAAKQAAEDRKTIAL
jgi:predicted dehydrogenase